MHVDLDQLSRSAASHFVPKVLEHGGAQIEPHLDRLMTLLKSLYRYFEESDLSGDLVVFVDADTARPADGCPRIAPADIRDHLTGIVLEARPDGLIAHQDGGVTVEDLSMGGLAYHRTRDGEWIVVSGVRVGVQPLLDPDVSPFAIPVFRDLRDALEHYRLRRVRNARCPELLGAWGDDNRLFFQPGPEDKLQASLESHLVATLRDAEVEVIREHTIGARKPVDIRVLFALQNRMALIEIKWLGKSRSDTGDITVNYSASHARKGARQLRKYLIDNRPQAGTSVVRGYLVVIDGRRRGLSPTSSVIRETSGMYYAAREVSYAAEDLDAREMAQPIRMFCEPICS